MDPGSSPGMTASLWVRTSLGLPPLPPAGVGWREGSSQTTMPDLHLFPWERRRCGIRLPVIPAKAGIHATSQGNRLHGSQVKPGMTASLWVRTSLGLPPLPRAGEGWGEGLPSPAATARPPKQKKGRRDGRPSFSRTRETLRPSRRRRRSSGWCSPTPRRRRRTAPAWRCRRGRACASGTAWPSGRLRLPG